MSRGNAWSLEETVDRVAQYITIQCGIRHLNPTSIKSTYLPGIAATFDMPGAEESKNNFRQASCQPVIKGMLKGFKRLFDKANPKSASLKMAFGMDLALIAKSRMERMRCFSSASCSPEVAEIQRARVFIVMAVGIFFMLRKSEHLVAKGGVGPSPLTRKCVLFFDKRGNTIPYKHIGVMQAEKVMIDITFSKTDHSGFGRRTYHVRQPALRSSCIVTLLEDWVRRTRDDFGSREEDALYHVPGIDPLRVPVLHDIMHETVQSLGVSGTGIKATSHSLRYGGATMLAAAGFPQYLIAHYGGWTANSTALRRYARPSDESIALVSEFMARITLKEPSKHYIQDLMLRQRSNASNPAKQW